MLVASATPIMTITVAGDKITIKSETTFKTTEFSFAFGEEFDEVTADGRNSKVN